MVPVPHQGTIPLLGCLRGLISTAKALCFFMRSLSPLWFIGVTSDLLYTSIRDKDFVRDMDHQYCIPINYS